MANLENYYLSPREDILDLLEPIKFEKVLDIGCGGGALGYALKEKGAIEVTGIEKEPRAADVAKIHLDNVYECDIESFVPHFKENYFDCIICADILEHLKEPWEFLKKYGKFLKENGYLAISVPNVRYYFVLYQLLRGEWDYSDRGIFDRTHLRFFTLKSIKKLLRENGFKILKINRNYRLREPYCLHQSLAKFLSLYIFRDFFTFQYVILAQKKSLL